MRSEISKSATRREVPPLRRLELYKAMLKYMQDWDVESKGIFPYGFCYALSRVKSYVDPPIFQNLSRYPELQDFKPAERSGALKRSGYWFERGTPEGVAIRVKILNEIINKLQNEINDGRK